MPVSHPRLRMPAGHIKSPTAHLALWDHCEFRLYIEKHCNSPHCRNTITQYNSEETDTEYIFRMILEHRENDRDVSSYLLKYCGISTTSEEWTGWTCEVCSAPPDTVRSVAHFWHQRSFPLEGASWQYGNEVLRDAMRAAGVKTVVDFAWYLLRRDRERLQVSGFPCISSYFFAIKLVELQLDCKPFSTSNDFVQRLFMGEVVFHPSVPSVVRPHPFHPMPLAEVKTRLGGECNEIIRSAVLQLKSHELSLFAALYHGPRQGVFTDTEALYHARKDLPRLRFSTNAWGLTPIRRRLVSYLVLKRKSARAVVNEASAVWGPMPGAALETQGALKRKA